MILADSLRYVPRFCNPEIRELVSLREGQM